MTYELRLKDGKYIGILWDNYNCVVPSSAENACDTDLIIQGKDGQHLAHLTLLGVKADASS